MNGLIKNKKIWFYFIITYGLAWFCWLPSLLISNGVNLPDIWQILGQFATLMPAVAVIIVFALYNLKSEIKPLLKKAIAFKIDRKWLLIIIFLPIIIVLLSYLIKIYFENINFELAYKIYEIPILLIMILITGGALEEIGWRGFALPQLLNSFNPLKASLILGFIHGLWHLPLHFIEGTVQSNLPIYEFILVTMIGAIIYTWFYFKTNKSLFAMILFHLVSNTAAALFVYWDTPLGRWLFFGIQLAVLIFILNTKVFKKQKNN